MDKNPCVLRVSILPQPRQQADRTARRQSLANTDFPSTTFIDEKELRPLFLGLNQGLRLASINLKS